MRWLLVWLVACSHASMPSTQKWTPPNAQKKVCSADELATYERACLGDGLPIQCQQFVANHGACASCLSAPGGPLISQPGSVSLNVGGCIALALGDSRPSGCGAREQAVEACTNNCDEAKLAACAELGGAASCTLGEFTKVAARFCS